MLAVPGALVAAVERKESLFGLLPIAEAFHVADAVHLEIHRPRAIAKNVVLGHALLQVDAVCTTRKQVDRRGAEQAEVVRVDGIVQARHAAIEQHDDLELVAPGARQQGLQVGELGEQEPLGAGKVFLQQAIATERTARVRDQRLAVVEAPAVDPGGVMELADLAVGTLRTHDIAERVAQQLLVQTLGQFIRAGDEHRQLVQRQHIGLSTRGNPELQAQAGTHRLAGGQHHAGRGDRRRRFQVFRVGQLERPQGDVVGRAIFAGGAIVLADQAAQGGVPRHGVAGKQPAFLQVGLHLHHGHRRHRRQVMRVDHFQQVLGEHRVLGIELQLDARRQEGEALQQAFDIGIGAFEAFQAKPTGDLRVLARELAAHLADVLQLPVVVAQQSRIHGQSAEALRYLEAAGFQVHLGLQVEVQGNRLRPHLRLDVEDQRLPIHAL